MLSKNSPMVENLLLENADTKEKLRLNKPLFTENLTISFTIYVFQVTQLILLDLLDY